VKDTLERVEPLVYTLLRFVVGALMALHGLQKLAGVLGMQAVPTGSQMWIGAVIELVGGGLVAVGLGTRLAAFIVSGQMAVAYFQFHWQLDMSSFHWVPLVNHGELAVVYCFAFLFFFARGGGPIALERVIAKT